MGVQVDTPFYIVVSVGFIAISLVMFLVSLPLIRGRVAMNKMYGIRLPKAFESEANWYAINTFGGKLLAACSIGFAVDGVLFGSIKPAPTAWSFWVFILVPLGLLAVVIWRIKSFAGQLP